MTDHDEKLRSAIATFDATANALPDKPQAAYVVVEAARLALAVFEKALGEATVTPTDDERANENDLLDFLSKGEAWQAIRGMDAPGLATELATAGFRRSEIPEPSAEPKHDESCAEWCNHCQACGEGIRYGSRCREHYQNQPQAEPSDAQLLAALTAYEAKAREQGSFPAMATPLNLTWFSDASADRMRAALRAGGVR